MTVNKTNRLTQAVVFFRRHFLCGALLCNCSSAKREGLSTHVQRECSAEPFMCSILSLRIFICLPGSRLRFFIAMQIHQSSYEHTFTAVDSMGRKPCVRKRSREREGLYNGNVQQNPLCGASCVTKDIPVSPRFSPTGTFFIAGQIQHPTVHSFLYTSAQIDAPCRLVYKLTTLAIEN